MPGPWDFPPAGFFDWPKEAGDVRVPPPLSSETLHPETRSIHAGTLRSQFGETSEALFLTQGFVYDSAEQCEAPLHRQGARLSLFALLQSDREHVRDAHGRVGGRRGRARHRDRHGGGAQCGDRPGQGRATTSSPPRRCSARAAGWSRIFCPRFGVASTLVNGLDLDEWRRAVRPNTKVFFLESPTNPTLEVLDIAAIAGIAHEAGAKLVVDNVFATPIFQSPLALGADCVVYSATKHIDGQGRCLGGIILGSENFIQDHIHNLLRQTGPAMSPFNAWVLLKGLETLALRVARQTATRRQDRRSAGPAPEDHAADLSGPRRPPAGRDRQETDARRL